MVSFLNLLLPLQLRGTPISSLSLPTPYASMSPYLCLSLALPSPINSSASPRRGPRRGRCPTHRGLSRRPARRSRCSSVRQRPCSCHRRWRGRESWAQRSSIRSTRSRCPRVYWGMPRCHRKTREKSGFANGLSPRMSRNSARTVCTRSSSERFTIFWLCGPPTKPRNSTLPGGARPGHLVEEYVAAMSARPSTRGHRTPNAFRSKPDLLLVEGDRDRRRGRSGDARRVHLR